MNKVRSDTVVTFIGCRVQEICFSFVKSPQIAILWWAYGWILNPIIGITLPNIYCYLSISMKYIDITTNSKKNNTPDCRIQGFNSACCTRLLKLQHCFFRNKRSKRSQFDRSQLVIRDILPVGVLYKEVRDTDI